MIPLNMYLPKRMHDILKKIAAEKGISMSDLVRRFVKKGLAQRRKKAL